VHNTWFTSDTHFGHTKILEYEKEARPFNSVEQMNECLIDRWNSVVRPCDTVYHLGDFCFGRRNIEIAAKLNGKKNLILGNHDTYAIGDYLKYFNKVFGALYWHNCVLTHIPVHPDNLGTRAWLNIHGHLHSHNVKQSWEGGWKNPQAANILGHDLNYLNVSVEQNNLYPFHSDEIYERAEKMSE
jgi:calcineurin-like phosphoesterase family protein